MTTLGVIWFLLVGVLFTGYAILDGFDLGVGAWHLRSKGDGERRTMLNSVGPVWDGDEVWLLTAGGATFGAFPAVYATVFSGFYLALMLVLLVLMLRAIAFEFRSQHPSPKWRAVWDVVFSISSILITILFGVALGNILRGVPLGVPAEPTLISTVLYTGSFFTLLNPYALVIGVLSLAMFAFHGSLYTAMKASGALEERARGWARISGPAYLLLFVVASGITIATQDHLLVNAKNNPIFWAVPVIAIAAIVGAIVLSRRGQVGRAFVASSVSIASMWGLVGIGLFPRLVPALGTPELSLTIANTAAGDTTLTAMLVVALVGMPCVLGYTIWVYRAFKGKVDVNAEGSHY